MGINQQNFQPVPPVLSAHIHGEKKGSLFWGLWCMLVTTVVMYLMQTIIAPSADGEALSSRSAEQQELQENLSYPVFDSVEDFFEYLWENADSVLRGKAGPMPEQPLVEKFESQLVLEPDQSQLVLASEDAQPVVAHGQKCSKEEIVQNGKKWMIEEVMVAFRKYRKRKNDLKDLDYEFDELHHQCFNVESYDKIFHHFNFTVKMKKPSSSDWTSTLYFAEVKEIFSHKIYFCSPLEPYENGLCYACKNQGIDDLKHPIIGAFDRGSPDSKAPFIYDDDSDYDDFYI
ncbi:hypothetical protein EJB05_33720, partial [Eragrostis curvula]